MVCWELLTIGVIIMGRWLKIFVLTLCVIILLLIIGAFILLNIDPNNYKDELSEKVTAMTGREFVIEGDISWTFFPKVKLQLSDATLYNIEPFAHSPFAKVSSISVDVKIKPLLNHRLDITKITLNGLELNLIRNASGKTNWQDLTQHAETQQQSQHTSDSHPKNDTKDIAIEVSEIILNGAALTLDNKQTDTQSKLNIEKLQTSSFNLNNTDFDLTSKFAISHNNPAVNFKGTFKSAINIDFDQKTYTFNNTLIKGQLHTTQFQKNQASFMLQGDIKYNHTADSLSIVALNGNLNNLKTNGHIEIERLRHQLGYTGSLNFEKFNLADFLSSIGRPPEMRIASLEPIHGHMDFAGDKDTINVKQLHGKLGDSTLNGDFILSRNPSIQSEFKLHMDKVDLDTMVLYKNAPSATQTNTRPPAKSAPKSTPKKTPTVVQPSFTLLKNLDAKGELQLDQLTYLKMNITEIHSHVEANKGVIKFTPLTGKLYQGNYQGYITVDLTGPKPKLTATENATNINLQELWQDVSGKSYITGTAQMSGKGSMIGDNWHEMLGSMNGHANVSIQNGAVPNIDASNLMEAAFAKYEHRKATQSSNSKTTFSSLTADFKIKDGVAHNHNFLLTSPVLTVTGKGKVNLATQKVHYNIEVSLSDNLLPDLVSFQNKVGGTVPFEVTGTVTDLSFKPDMPDLLKRMTEKRMGKELNNIHKKLEKATGLDLF